MEDENIIVNQPTVEYDSVGIIECDEAANVEPETLEVIEVGTVDTFTVGTDNAFPELGEQNQEMNHSYFRGRELPDQHPISSISGLRQELDNIESLKTVYSNGKNHADYFLWKDENPEQNNRVGLFVYTCEDTNQIQICTEKSDIFGVTVGSAAFVGGESNTPRDYKYGLVVCTGVVAVKCELEVSVGDYVVSNNYGVAKKSTSGYGYKVFAVQNIGIEKYAIIPLGIPINQINSLMDEFYAFDKRMDKAEANIVSAINVANEAHNKAMETVNISNDAIQKAIDALQNVNNAMDNVDNLSNIVSSANQSASQAKAIANSAATTAQAAREEAIKAANENTALITDEVNSIKKDMSGLTEEVNDKVDYANELIDELTEEMKPFSEWSDGTNSGVSGFVAKSNSDSSELAEIAKWKGENSDAIAAIIQEAGADGSTIEMLASWKRDVESDVGNIVNISSKADVNESSLQNLTVYIEQYIVGKLSPSYGFTTDRAIDFLEKDVVYIPTVTHIEDNESETEIIHTEFIQGRYYVWNGTWWNASGIDTVMFSDTYFDGSETLIYWVVTGSQDVVHNEATYVLDTLYLWKNNKWIAVATIKGGIYNRSISQISQISNANESALSAIVDYSYTDDEGNTKSGLAGLSAKADANESKLETIAGWQGDITNSIASIQQKADENGAEILSIASSIDKYSVGEYSQEYGLTLEQAKSILQVNMIYIPTVDHSEIYINEKQNHHTTNFTKGYHYIWKRNVFSIISIGDSIRRYDGWKESANPSVYFISDSVPEPTEQYIYWYVDGYTAPDGYEPYALYIADTNGNWKKVNILDGNVTNRIASMICQKQDSISLEIANARGDAASLGLRINPIETSITQTVQNIGIDGEVNAASIVASVNNSDSSVTINADHINFVGYSTFLTAEDLGVSGTTSIYGDRIKSGTITANNNASWINLNNGNFSFGIVDGLDIETYEPVIKPILYLDNNTLHMEGTIESTNGHIGNWTIGEYSITSTTTSNGISSTVSLFSFDNYYWSGSSGRASDVLTIKNVATDGTVTYPFYLWKDGTISCTKGTIGGWKIEPYALKSMDGALVFSWANDPHDYFLYANGKFGVKYDGSMICTEANISGTITANSGSIGGWVLAEDRIYNTSQTGYEFSLWNPGIAEGDIISSFKEGDCPFRVDRSGHLFATGAAISGKITASSGSIGGWDIQNSGTYSGGIHGSADGYEVWMTPKYLSARAPEDTVEDVRWYSIVFELSDRRVKNSISQIDDQYESFYNELNPVTFKYNENISPDDYDKLRFGFIAQDIIESASNNGIDDLAIIYGNGYYKIEKKEIIALNTWQIQKAKARISDLETRVAELEALIKEK